MPRFVGALARGSPLCSRCRPLARQVGPPPSPPLTPHVRLRCDGSLPSPGLFVHIPVRPVYASMHRRGGEGGYNERWVKGQDPNSPRPPPSFRGRVAAAAAASATRPLQSSSGGALSARPLSLRRRHPCRGFRGHPGRGEGGGRPPPFQTPPPPSPCWASPVRNADAARGEVSWVNHALKRASWGNSVRISLALGGGSGDIDI